jgi:signal transduction histidine kinase
MLHLPAAAQMPAKIDSLKYALSKPVADTTETQILLSIAMKYQGFQTDSAMDYALASLEKSEAIGYTKGRADALLHIGRLKRDLDNTVDALNDMFVALKLYREISDHVQIANALNDISIIYANSGDFHSSLDYFKQALEIFRQTGDEKGESYALNNVGLIYLELDDEAAAKEHFILSLKIKEKNNDLYGISRGHINLGTIEENNQQWADALYYYLKADSLFRLTNDSRAQAGNFVAIARIKAAQNKNAEAKAYALRGLEQSRAVKALTTMLNASKLLASLEEKGRNYKASLEYQKLYNTIADSLHNENNRANLEELKAKFNVDEKVREIALLKKDQELQQAVVERKNIITYALSAGIVLMLLILALVYYAYATTKSKKDSLALKNKEIQSQKDDLDTLNREKDRFFSILSHDLRGPLSSLKGLSYLLTDHVDALTPAELGQMRTRINTSLDNLTELINNVLEWSMASSRKRKWLFDKINTADIIRKNISLYQAIADSKGVSLVYKPQEDLYAYGDYYAIDTVVRNLLSNGIKFSHTGKAVTLSADKADDAVLISVRDEGIGIPEETQKKLFALNGTVTQPGTNNEKGIGLGLTLCMELMKENNGDIRVKSKPNEGSEFIISVPVFKGTNLALSA